MRFRFADVFPLLKERGISDKTKKLNPLVLTLQIYFVEQRFF